MSIGDWNADWRLVIGNADWRLTWRLAIDLTIVGRFAASGRLMNQAPGNSSNPSIGKNQSAIGIDDY